VVLKQCAVGSDAAAPESTLVRVGKRISSRAYLSFEQGASLSPVACLQSSSHTEPTTAAGSIDNLNRLKAILSWINQAKKLAEASLF